jgi:hypothetical protein
MSEKPVPRGATLLLIAGAVILPVAIAVLWGVSTLLGQMGDPEGGLVLRYVALGVGICWVIDLVCLLLVQGVNSLTDHDGPPEP